MGLLTQTMGQRSQGDPQVSISLPHALPQATVLSWADPGSELKTQRIPNLRQEGAFRGHLTSPSSCLSISL